jgi:hypothetical protein
MSTFAVAPLTHASLPMRELGHWPVVVVGGGPSGTVAAIAAARLGARTLVIEQYGFLGGALTAMGVHPMMSFHNRAGQQLVAGIAQEVVECLVAVGASPGHIPDSIMYNSTLTPFDSTMLRLVYEEMLAEAGGEVLFHAMLVHAAVTEERLTHLIVGTRAGLVRIDADIVIDATGDADLAALAGVPCILGRGDGTIQPMTMNMKVANVDMGAVRRYAEEHPEDFWFKDGPEAGIARLRLTPRVSLGGFRHAWQAAKAAGEVDNPREDILFFETATPGVVVLNVSRIQELDPTDPIDLTRAEQIGRQQCRQLLAVLRERCPGFSQSLPMDGPVQVGVREGRHPQGRYTLTAEDLVNEVPFADPIARGGYPIDIHATRPGSASQSVHMRADAAYAIPLQSLLVEAPANLLLAGRAISATHEASAAIRVTPIAMATGQAAGTLGALAVGEGMPPVEVPYAQVRDALLAGGAIV